MKMKMDLGIFLWITVAILLSSCVGVAQTLNTSTPARTQVALPTDVPQPLPTQDALPTSETNMQDPTLQKLIAQARADLSKRANAPDSAITVVSALPVEWRDASLGCPIEGMLYAQALTPGYLIVLETNGQTYDYHTSNTLVVYCDK